MEKDGNRRSRVMELARGFSYTTLNKTRALKEKTNMDNIITDKCVLYCARIQIIIVITKTMYD